MKKKILCAVITSAMVLSLTACGSSSSKAEKAASAAASAATSTVEEAVSTAQAAASEAADAAKEAVSEVASAAEEAVSKAASAAQEAVSEAASTVEEAASEAASIVEEAVSEAASAAEEAVSTAEETASELAGDAESAASEVVSEVESAASKAESAAESAVSEAESAAESAVSEAESAAESAASEAESAAESAASEAEESEAEEALDEDSDVAYIMDKGVLIVGITDFAPMDYKDDDGNWVGFDADMAQLVAADLGVDIEFVEIDWDNKILELNNKSIDVVWNGMTLTDEVMNSMETTDAYLNNAQVVVVPSDKAEDIEDEKSIEELKFAVEAGSAGEAIASELGLDYTAVTSQADTLLEVKSGTSDASIIDLLMADAMIGEGTSYPDLTHTLELTTEEYGVGCRVGSDLADFINDEFDALYESGVMKEIAETYGVAAALVEQD